MGYKYTLKNITSNLKLDIHNLRNGGMSNKNIATVINASETTIRKVLQEQQPAIKMEENININPVEDNIPVWNNDIIINDSDNDITTVINNVDTVIDKNIDNVIAIDINTPSTISLEPEIIDVIDILPESKPDNVADTIINVDNVIASTDIEQQQPAIIDTVLNENKEYYKTLCNLGKLDAGINNNESESDKIRKKDILLKIRLYIDNFNERLSQKLIGITKQEQNKFISNLNECSIIQLEEYLEQIRIIITQNNAKEGLKRAFVGTCSLIETTSPYLGLNLKGYTACMCMDPNTSDLITEIYIENASYFQKFTNPIVRLGIVMGSTALQLDGANNAREKQQQKQQEENKQ